MSEELTNLETAVEGFLAKEPNPTPERIRELIDTFRGLDNFRVSDGVAEDLARTFETRHSVTMTVGSVLTAREYEPWLDQARTQIDPYYWDRYRKLLTSKHLSSQVLATLDEVTDRILGLLENPNREGPWDRRGMVMGHVQSGKTANYTGLISKAADAGYKLVVVIAGVHNNLRNQTQLRIDEGFVGRDSARLLSESSDKFVGVGRFDSSRRPVTFTNSVRDFNKAMASGVGVSLRNLNEPAVFVIKKNPRTLANLLEWLKEHSAQNGGTVDIPMLLIDDEADNASINIRSKGNVPSTINGQIRDLLKMFERSCYIGYTATPFANIFIDPDTDDEMRGHDLFPCHFILSLDPPSDYFGADRVFQQDSDQIVRHIKDNEDWLPLKHKHGTAVKFLPASLQDALRTFLVGRAVRLARGHDQQHCSMLVNASRFTDVQRQLRNEIHNRLEHIQASVRINGALPQERALKDLEISELHRVWEDEFAGKKFSWSEIQGHLQAAVAPVKVVEVNSRSSGNLNYADYEKTGLNVIAVGGLSLSRGLTLEGLTVSYFLRNSMMYDTLMQMGRWFGFRPDYDDLCRIWMPEEAEGWYAHIAESIELLRKELRTMEASGSTPEEFGLRVRSDPNTLIVTARNKLGSGQKVVVKIGLGNSFIETATLRRSPDGESPRHNLEVARQFTSSLASAGIDVAGAEHVPSGWLIHDVLPEPVMDFITAFRNHPGSMLTEPGPVRQYVSDRRDSELARWDVLFASILKTEGSLFDDSLGLPIYCQRRKPGERSTADTLTVTNKQRVSSRGVEKTGLKSEQVRAVEHEYRDEIGKGSKPINYPDRIYRHVRARPLLIIHLLKIVRPEKVVARRYWEATREASEPVVAYSISFPRTAIPEKQVEYVVNANWLREVYKGEFDSEELDDDDD